MLVSNCLTKEECENIKNHFLSYIKNFPQGNEDDLVVSSNVYGLCYPFLKLKIDYKQILLRLSNFIHENFKAKYEFENSFLRVYYNNSILRLHNDRQKFDLTLSVNIDGIENWPIHISNIRTDHDGICPETDGYEELCNQFKKDYCSIITPKGCGVFCMGREYVHWRDLLQCKSDEYVMQIFFHWRKV